MPSNRPTCITNKNNNNSKQINNVSFIKLGSDILVIEKKKFWTCKHLKFAPKKKKNIWNLELEFSMLDPNLVHIIRDQQNFNGLEARIKIKQPKVWKILPIDLGLDRWF